MGSVSDADLMRTCWQQLAELGVESEVRVASAHRTPDLVAELVGGAEAGPVKWHHQPFSLRLTLPPLSASFFLSQGGRRLPLN